MNPQIDPQRIFNDPQWILKLSQAADGLFDHLLDELSQRSVVRSGGRTVIVGELVGDLVQVRQAVRMRAIEAGLHGVLGGRDLRHVQAVVIR